VVFSNTDSGFDLTDESFYILWMSDPWAYGNSATQFGFVLYPFYKLLGGSIALLRQANLVVTSVLSFSLSFIFLHRLAGAPLTEEDKRNHGRWILIAGLSVALASTSGLMFYPWWPTPSYNSLGFQALLLAGIGGLLADRGSDWRSLIGWFLLGVAGWLSFMAKPTSAAALAVAVGCYVVASKKFSLRLVLLSACIAGSLLMISALAIDGSIIGFFRRLEGAADLYRKLDAGHELEKILRIDSLRLGSLEGKVFYSCMLFLSGCTIFLYTRKAWGAAIVFSVFIGLAAFLFISDFIEIRYVFKRYGIKSISYFSFGPKVIFAVPAAVFLASLIMTRARCLLLFKRPESAGILFFLVFPYVYAMGTNNSYWFNGPMAGLFWIMASVLFLCQALRPRSSLALAMPVIAMSQLITVWVLMVAVEFPYRQVQALSRNHAHVQIGEGRRPLRVAKAAAAYFSSLRDTAQTAGFQPGGPLIDLTGYQPGVAIVLGARPVGQPWLPGGYRGSRDYAEAVLDGVSCDEIARAWILTEPSGRRALPSDILMRYGVDLSKDVLVAGTFIPPGQAYPQMLLKPSRTSEEGERECKSRRNSVS